MKTTVDLPKDLLEEAKAVASAERTTLRELVIDGLRRVLTARRAGPERFVLRDASVPGQGVYEGVTEGNWDAIRDLAYRGRGS